MRITMWRWRYSDDFGKRRVTRYLLCEEEAHARLRDPEKLEHTLEVRGPIGSTNGFQRSPREP